MTECGCAPETVNASSIGFMLAPRINAAGRMGRIELAIELFLTDDEERAGYLAKALCELNKQRQNVEAQIYNEAVSMLPEGKTPAAIVLADESWHQGVVGIVASRMAEEYCCPAFLICLDGDHGKASSRSYGGFNLFSSLTKLAPLLESYGGHELAAGFTITRQQIPSFRQAICELVEQHYTDGVCRTQIEIDCAVTPELLTVRGIDSLSALEPCGNGCPKPVLMMEKLTIDRISLVGGGRHMRLRFRDRFHTINAIFFSATPESASVQPGDVVDVAFYPQINEFKGERSVQMNVLDIRPHCDVPCDTNTAGYAGLRKGETTPAEAAQLLPDRNTLGTVWRYLAGAEAPLREEPMCLCRKIVRWSGRSLTLGQLLTALDIFRDVGLLEIQKQRKTLTLIPTPGSNKADLNESKTMQTLLKAKES